MDQILKLSPSDLTFLWDECPRCFYLKVVRNFNRPRSPFPKIFNRIDKLMKDYFEGKSTSDIYPDLPAGIVKYGEKWVTSQPVHLHGRRIAGYIRGKFDTVVEFADHSYGIIDFKTSETKPEHVAFYGRQLHAYAYALENPAAGSLALSPITRLGLLTVEPVLMERTHSGRIAYLGEIAWQECPKDEGAFLAFLDEVLATLEAMEPPEPGLKCGYCAYRESARLTNL